jgi:hypothetical protein
MTPAASEPVQWFTVERAAELCQRSPKTIRNLISRHQLPRKILWKVRRRKRLRVMFLSPQTVRTLQELTLEAPLVKK